ncbi:MAG: hypothetical protein JEZ03_12380 [Bacteroidales bacterium]|nr:hypothetical protein [Bacteroidales bacterium]
MMKIGKPIPKKNDPVKKAENFNLPKEDIQIDEHKKLQRALFGLRRKQTPESASGNVWQRLMKRSRVRGQGLRGREGRVT